MKKMIKSLDEINSVRAYLARIGAEARSLKSAIIKEAVDTYHKDVSSIRFTDNGAVICKEKYKPTEEERLAIEEEFKLIKFPAVKTLATLITLPNEIKDVPRDDIFEFRNINGEIIMLQVKRLAKDGTKYFLPYTYWDDEEWRRVEPEDGLPLWGLEKIGNNTTVFIHEGAKAARAVQRMVLAETTDQKEKLEDHPWGVELSAAAHVGWVGGALAPERTDWGILNTLGLKAVYIVSDNDKAGVSAVASIAYALRVPTFHLQFTNEWPAAFDLADEFPDHMFKILEKKPRYIGPHFRSCIHPATWATDLSKGEGDRPIITLRDHFKDMWAYIEESDTFVCKFMPNIIRQEKILNNMLASFSHTPLVSQLIFKEYSGRTATLCYRPDRPEQIITQGNSSSINLHIPTLVRSEVGDPDQFLGFMEYMFPIDDERKNVLRWVATIIARPDLRMEYGLLLISEATGIGKTTLGAKILAPLVNPYNVGFPRETDIVDSGFNGWVANKRLVIVNEIYSGQSWKAYHSLKSIITDKDIAVNEKFQRPYVVENWAHIFACSNSRKALKMEGDDRRWMYPEVNEERWPRERFTALLDWLSSGGLGVIKHWAENYGDYVHPGERAPMTKRKREMIEGSRSEAQSEAAELAEALINLDKPAAMAMKDIIGHIRDTVQGKVFDSDYEIRKTMVEVGAVAYPKRVRVHGRLQYVVMNVKLKNQLLNNDEKANELIAAALLKPNDLIETTL